MRTSHFMMESHKPWDTVGDRIPDISQEPRDSKQRHQPQ
jgi:hypothetical protein